LWLAAKLFECGDDLVVELLQRGGSGFQGAGSSVGLPLSAARTGMKQADPPVPDRD
jgi:hypothetical protein